MDRAGFVFEGDLRGQVADCRHAHGVSVAGVSMTRTAPRPRTNDASPSRRTFDRPAGRSEDQRLVTERVVQPVGPDPVRVAAERDERDEVADPARQRHVDGAAVGARSADEPDAGEAVEEDGGPAAEGRMGEEREVGDRVIQPATTEARRGRSPRRRRRSRAASMASSVSDSFFSAATRSTGTPPARSASRSAGAIESPSPTHRSIVRPSGAACRAPPSAAMTNATPSDQPGQAASSSARFGDVAIGQDEAWHGGRSRRRRTAASRDGSRPSRQRTADDLDGTGRAELVRVAEH